MPLLYRWFSCNLGRHKQQWWNEQMLVDKQSELMSDLLSTVHQHSGDDVTWKPPIIWRKKIVVIHLSLTSEFPWRNNDVITFFYLPLYFSVPGIFIFRNRLTELVSPLIPFETVSAKRRVLFRPTARKENLISVRSAAFFTIFACNFGPRLQISR